VKRRRIKAIHKLISRYKMPVHSQDVSNKNLPDYFSFIMQFTVLFTIVAFASSALALVASPSKRQTIAGVGCAFVAPDGEEFSTLQLVFFLMIKYSLSENGIQRFALAKMQFA
jgi:hypothetical protein